MRREVKVGRREAALVVAKRLPVTLPEIGGAISGSFGEVYGHLGRIGGVPEGPPFVIYHGTPASGEPFDIEICAPVPVAVEPPAGWQLVELPAGTFATLLHVGPYDTIGTAYAEIMAWPGEHGYAIAGPPREVYLSDPETPPEQIRTIVELPVVEVAAPVAAG
jgi:effector-binding domain-containing protein